MITAADLTGIITSDEYTALQTAIDNTAESLPMIRCTLRQYAPVWESSSVPGGLSGILTPQTLYTAELTENDNYRLTRDSVGSDIYWPFQVRSLDAVSLDNYDIIAMVTDLPPIVDTTTSESKSSFSFTRVQGIVLWKYQNGHWSDHWTWDVCDSTQDTVRADVKLTRDGAYVYMTYSKTCGGIHGLAITRSRDGLNWEDPVIYNASTTTTPPLTALARDGDYMYLISGASCVRSIATDYMGTIADAAVQDITDYVMSVSLNLGEARSLTVELANPDNVLLTAPNILALNVSTRLSFEAGYRLANEELTPIYVPIMTGDVTEWTSSEQRPVNHLTLQVKDSLSLMDVIGSSEAIEWQGLTAAGDNYCPVNADDLTGATGLSKSQVKGGVWTGTQAGVKFECDGRERILLSTFEGRAFNGMISSEWSFYQPVDPVNMATGSTGTEIAMGDEYAGIVFRYRDEHNLWFVRVKASGLNGGEVALIERRENPANTHLHQRDYTPTNQTEYAAMHVDTELATAQIILDEDYWHYYPGRITVEWRYGLVRVWQNYPSGETTQLISFEVSGIGNNGYTNQATPMVAGYCGHLVYSQKDGTVELAPNGDAATDTTYWNAENMDQANVTRVASPVREGGSAHVIRAITTGGANDPGVFYRMGNQAAPLNIVVGADPLHIDFSAHAYILSGDTGLPGTSDASLIMKCKLYYTTDPDNKPSQKGSKGYVTAFGSWTDYSWSMDTLANKTIRRFELSFIDQRGEDYRVGDTTFYVADLHAKLTVPKAYWYLGNVDFSDGAQVYTAHDALQALYAFSGSHFMDRKALVNEASFSGNTAVDVPLPYVVECDINAGSGTIHLTGASNPINFNWYDGYCTITLGSNSFYRSVAKTISSGRLRIAVTSASSEGKTFTNDLNNICDWVTVAVYLDDQFIMDAVIPISGARMADASLTEYAGTDIGGFRIGSGGTVANFRVDELHRHIPYFSIDPTEMASASLGRIIGVTRSVSLMRFNQHILIGRTPLMPDVNNPAWTIPTSLETRWEGAYSAVVPVHFRLIGAWTEKETIDTAAMHSAWRHFFFKKDDPNLMTADEMAVESQYLLKDLQYTRKRTSTSVKFNPLVEYGDVIAANGFSWLLDQAQWMWQKAGGGMKSTGSMVLKKI